MAINPATPFLFNPFPQNVPLPARQAVRNQAPGVLPARLDGAMAANNGDRNGESGLPSFLEGGVLPAALLGLGLGRSIQGGSVDPLLGAGTGLLTGISQRQQREAEARAEAEQQAREAEAEQRKERLAERQLRQKLEPEIRFSRGGFTGSFTPQAVPGSIFGQPLTPGAREQEESERLEKGLTTLESAFEQLPVERFSRPFQAGGQFFRHDPDTGNISVAPGSPEPTITVRGRRFPDTPEGQQAALEWTRQQGAAGRKGDGGGDDTGAATENLGTQEERQDFALAQLHELAEVIDDESELRRNLVQRLKNLDIDNKQAQSLATNAMQRWRTERRTETRFQERDKTNRSTTTTRSVDEALDVLEQR